MTHCIPLAQGLRAALRRTRQRAGLPEVLLAVGLLLTMLITLATAQADQQRRHRRAVQLAQDVGDALTNRLDSTVAILSATAGLFEASETVSRQEFHRFFHALNLSPETLRGIQGIGFAARVPAGSERQRFIARIRADGQPDFRIWPESGPAGSGDGAEREPALTSAIVFIQPQEWRNRRAIGYDMYTQSTRRSAMARAALSRQPMLTGPVRLVQEADNDIQVGTLVYLPISRGGIDRAEESTDTLNNLMGWAYAPMRMGDLLKTSLALVQNPDLHQSRVMLFDGTRPVQEARLADSDPEADPGAPAGTVWIQRPVLDRQWLIGVSANPVPRTLLNLQPVVLLTALAGVLASTLAALGARLVLSNQRMTLDALEKAKKASEERALAAAVFDSSPIGMIVTDPDGVVQETNVAFTQISGWSQREAVGHKANLLRSGRHDDLFYRHLWESIIQRGYWNGEIWNRHRNGQIRRHELSITAVVNGQQQITHFIGMLQDITDRHAEQEQVRHQALHDTLTGLPNRSLLMDQLQRSLALERRRGGRVALLFMDLDGFKPVNDRHGHQLGDALLQAVASRLKREIRASDTLCRQGGDEFVLLVPEAGSDADLLHLAEKLRQAVAEPYAELADDIAITMSVGIACWPEHASDAEGLLQAADAAMYAAKRRRDQQPGLAPVLRLGDRPEENAPCTDPDPWDPAAQAVAERPAE
ncbi:MAG: CHASE domain-containing protein [Cyanobacteriota bacterium]|nr:CHASE domain-containing protein [Cyanobacteriota bacterium]